MKPVVFITAGDPLGIGPEVTVKALRDVRIQNACSPVVIGEPTSLKRFGFRDELARLIALDSPDFRLVRPQPTHAGGLLSFKAVELGCKLAKHTGCPLVTAPISKQSWSMASVPFTGHTEFLRSKAGQNGLMMFVSGKLRCALVSEHFAIGELSRILTKKRIVQTAQSFHNALEQLGIEQPQIALSALNPHAGDNGKFGEEEKTRISPALKELVKKGFKIKGPFPIDSLWKAHANGEHHGILCMYHDQALLGLKLAAKEPIIHITAGLDFLRTSPTHGTAFDISGKNQADPTSMAAAILFAAERAKMPDF